MCRARVAYARSNEYYLHAVQEPKVVDQIVTVHIFSMEQPINHCTLRSAVDSSGGCILVLGDVGYSRGHGRRGPIYRLIRTYSQRNRCVVSKHGARTFSLTDQGSRVY